MNLSSNENYAVPTKKYILSSDLNGSKVSSSKLKKRHKHFKPNPVLFSESQQQKRNVNNWFENLSSPSVVFSSANNSKAAKNNNTEIRDQASLETIMSNLSITSDSFKQSEQNIYKLDKNLKLKRIFSLDYLKKLNQELSNGFYFLSFFFLNENRLLIFVFAKI